MTFHWLKGAQEYMPANANFQILTVRGNQCRDTPKPNHDEYYENALYSRSESEAVRRMIEKRLNGREEDRKQSDRTFCQKAQTQRKVKCPPPKCRVRLAQSFPVGPRRGEKE